VIASGEYCTIPRPVNHPLVTNWKKTKIAHAK
jgi:hypothetical protein